MKYRIAIIEDEFYTRQAIRKYIEKLGDPFEFCAEASDGSEGLKMLRSTKPDIALVDITMPVMNGIEMIQQAYDEGLPTRMVILTGYSEFSYARAAVRLGVDDYLLKPLRIEDLKRTLEHTIKRIRRSSSLLPEGIVIENLLSNQLAEQLTRSGADSIDTLLLLEHLGFPRNTGTYYVALVDYSLENSQAHSLCSLSSNTLKALHEYGFHAIGYQTDVHSMCFVINVPDTQPYDKLCAALKSIDTSIQSEHSITLRISLSCGCQTLSLIHDAYLEAQVVQQYYVFSPSQGTELYTSENLICTPNVLFDSKMRHTFSILLQQRDAKNIRTFIFERFDALQKTKANSTSVYLCAAEIMSVILEYTSIRSSEKNSDAASQNMIPSLFSINHIDALREFIITQALNAIDNSDSDKNAHSLLIRRVHEYIEQNFSNSALRLEDVAQANFISTQYLCSVYKKATGNTVGDYIFDVRMRHAQKLIKDDQRNVTAISEACGYEDPNYFGKCFRKKYGITPKQYIESQPL